MKHNQTGVYVHFPWCLAKCPYCDFVSYAKERTAIDHSGYADAVLRELDARREAIGDRFVGSIFFGGGTPSLWEPRELGRVLRAIREHFSCAPDLEITVECNPTSLDRERAAALMDAGVGRLSIGTQSLRAEQLRFLGRLHDSAGALAAIHDALAAGVPRISTDIIFGLPDQSAEDARDQALALADLGLTHLSCYQLTIEPGTQFGELARRGRLPLADDGRTADAFLAIDEALSSRGFRHYEISNYAQAGEESRHNLGYWRGEEYIGLGCAAFGCIRPDAAEPSRVRYRNAIDPKRYIEGTSTMRSDRTGEGDGLSMFSERVDPEALLREKIMLGLRTEEGVDLEASARDLDVEAWPRDRRRAADRLASMNRLTIEGGHLSIPRSAWLFTDDTAARLF
ncbi:radical SAM family heme chaperone HemW [Pendulispora albinea]|uniref:Heme chaperone HemW n=1 Tax=Pendulispora albinea TaxID=2741071 RepID=A0ABZ2LPC2_9BACT